MEATIRQQMWAALEENVFSAKELSGLLGIPEGEVYFHLEHLRRTLQTSGRKLKIIPASCRTCGYIFKKREKLKKPGRCPQCRNSSIAEPLFTAD